MKRKEREGGGRSDQLSSTGLLWDDSGKFGWESGTKNWGVGRLSAKRQLTRWDYPDLIRGRGSKCGWVKSRVVMTRVYKGSDRKKLLWFE